MQKKQELRKLRLPKPYWDKLRAIGEDLEKKQGVNLRYQEDISKTAVLLKLIEDYQLVETADHVES